MFKKILGLTIAAAVVTAVSPVMAPAQAKDIKIGFVTTLTTPAALIGKQMKMAVELAMDHIGHKMGGRNVKILFEDDGFNPKIG
ncbi:MAG TPA: ABC transporter substrate-binding protein, partial [Rhodospirillales bacterium]|nr:ABC transporter substrate-binding protein [Rhodospirillales bacterium]